MKFFVTGGTGFVGGHVVRQLLKAGHVVHALVRSPEKAQDIKSDGAVLFEGDITDNESMRAGMIGMDGVFHIAGWYEIGARDAGLAENINVEGTRNVLALMQELGIPKGVYTSTLAVNSDTQGKTVDETYEFTGKHISIYDRTKAEAHQVAEQFIAEGLPLVIVQPGVIYGPGDSSSLRTNLVLFLKGRLPVIPKKTAFTFAHVEDVADGHILAMEKGRAGESYFICGPVYTFEEFIAIAAEIAGIPRLPLKAPPVLLKGLAAVAGIVERFVPLPETYTSEGLRIIAGVTYLGDNAKANRELGFGPRPLWEGLRETIEHELRQMEQADG